MGNLSVKSVKTNSALEFINNKTLRGNRRGGIILEKPKEEFVLTNLKIFDPSSFVTVKNEMLKFYE